MGAAAIPPPVRFLHPFVYIIGAVVFVVLPLFLPAYTQSLMTKILIYAIFAMSLDLIYGYAGLPSLGHAAYFGVGAYTVGVLMVKFDISSFWIAAPLTLLLTGLAAAVLGIVALRVSGLYFLLVTFALGQLLFSVAWKWDWLSSYGVEGLAGLSRPDFGVPGFSLDSTGFYYFVLLIAAICLVAMRRLVTSPFGLALQGIRERELRMRLLGFNTWACKYTAFVIAGMFAGVAGMLFAYHRGIVLASYFDIRYSALAFLMVIIGGTGTLYGAIVGALLISLLEYYASLMTPDRWPLVLGAAFVLAGMYARAGVGVIAFRLCERALLRWKP